MLLVVSGVLGLGLVCSIDAMRAGDHSDRLSRDIYAAIDDDARSDLAYFIGIGQKDAGAGCSAVVDCCKASRCT
jgi:hypothetical protein